MLAVVIREVPGEVLYELSIPFGDIPSIYHYPLKGILFAHQIDICTAECKGTWVFSWNEDNVIAYLEVREFSLSLGIFCRFFVFHYIYLVIKNYRNFQL